MITERKFPESTIALLPKELELLENGIRTLMNDFIRKYDIVPDVSFTSASISYLSHGSKFIVVNARVPLNMTSEGLHV